MERYCQEIYYTEWTNLDLFKFLGANFRFTDDKLGRRDTEFMLV